MLKRFLIALLLSTITMVACGKTDHNEKSSSGNDQVVAESEKLPDFTLRALTGETVNLRRLEGQKVVVVNFWATWCGPCRHEIPDFNDVYSRYRDRGVEILGVSVDQSPETVVPDFMNKIPITYPVLLGSPELMYDYAVRGLPTTFIIDRSGRVASRFIGMISASTLQAELDKLL
jgi:peroxiredoxin